MKIIKTLILSLLLITVIAVIYLNNITTDVTLVPEEYQSCSKIYYHPTYTFAKRQRSHVSQGLFWITNDKQVVEELVIMPGMKVNLSVDEDQYGDQYYTLMYKDTKYGGVGRGLSSEEADYVIDNIDGLVADGDQVEVSNYIGYIDGQLTVIEPSQMLGQASGCKESK